MSDHYDMTITLRFFARARDLAGTDSGSMTLPEGATVATLRALLLERYPDLAPVSRQLLVAVNARYATDDSPIPPGAEVAVFPPVSGG